MWRDPFVAQFLFGAIDFKLRQMELTVFSTSVEPCLSQHDNIEIKGVDSIGKRCSSFHCQNTLNIE